jgi:hypothetical protein
MRFVGIMANASSQQWPGRLMQELKRDKKRTAVLAILVVVCAVVCIRALAKNVPATADASVNVVALAAHGNGNTAGQLSLAAAADDSAVSQADLSVAQRKDQVLGKHIQSINRKITRDIFAVRLEQFPLEAVVVQPTVEASTQPAKADIDPAEVQRQEIRQLAAGLSLQSTIAGSTPTAIINDRVLTIGDWISGFVVVEISDQACVVQKLDVKVTLSLKDKDKSKGL